MIDLRKESLPDSITVDGKDYLIKTNFREWLKFGEMAKEPRPLSDYFFIFQNEIPKKNFFEKLVEFYLNPNLTPKKTESVKEKIIDFIEDGEYIVASFYKDYKIDLTKENLHWHLFNALFSGLSDDTKIKQIMAMRSWKNEKKSYEQRCKENKEAWSLPLHSAEEEREILEELDKLFYNS